MSVPEFEYGKRYRRHAKKRIRQIIQNKFKIIEGLPGELKYKEVEKMHRMAMNRRVSLGLDV